MRIWHLGALASIVVVILCLVANHMVNQNLNVQYILGAIIFSGVVSFSIFTIGYLGSTLNKKIMG